MSITNVVRSITRHPKRKVYVGDNLPLLVVTLHIFGSSSNEGSEDGHH